MNIPLTPEQIEGLKKAEEEQNKIIERVKEKWKNRKKKR